ncbi:MAG: hypothetical protein KAR05_08845 [Candidatus Omnitrophica bacterium]|nr:hypothetical protein [Candidatus Omnitrophota bacterium]
MSKAARNILLVFIILLAISVYFALALYLDKNRLEGTNLSLEKEIADYQKREKDYIVKNKGLIDQIKALEKEKADIESRLGNVDVDITGLDDKIAGLTKERDDWKTRVNNLQAERDELIAKLQKKPETEIVYKTIKTPVEEARVQTETTVASAIKDTKKKVTYGNEEENHWAQILKEKAALELELGNLKDSLSDSSLEVAEMKKANSDMGLELSELQNEKERIEREIKYGQDLSDNLSLELARAQNDKKFFKDRIDKMSGENDGLRHQIKRLTSTKIALEKSIVRLQDEKKTVERRLVETENVIQSRIDEIWDIKKSIDNTFTANKFEGGEIELPPIIVMAQEDLEPLVNVSVDPNVGKAPGYDGNVVSINDDNNFVIVDVGKNSGIHLGDLLNVYRGAEYIAGLEVIQVRDDIAAADIRTKTTEIKVGDIVR